MAFNCDRAAGDGALAVVNLNVARSNNRGGHSSGNHGHCVFGSGADAMNRPLKHNLNADPTQTGDLRKRYSIELDIRWRKFNNQLRAALLGQDLLGLTDRILSEGFSLAALSPDGRLRFYQGFVDQSLNRMVLEHGHRGSLYQSGHGGGAGL